MKLTPEQKHAETVLNQYRFIKDIFNRVLSERLKTIDTFEKTETGLELSQKAKDTVNFMLEIELEIRKQLGIERLIKTEQ